MTWVLVALVAGLAFMVAVIAFKVPPGGREAIGAALLLGIAGYALQGEPDLSGKPTPGREKLNPDAAAMVAARQRLAPTPPGGDKGLIVADALARNGNYAAATEILRGATERDPHNADAWLAMANALVSHADGQVSPAALVAFRRAETAAPNSPGPPFFLGLALAQSGRLADGRAVWAELLARTPGDAPWRAELVDHLGQLDAFIARRAAAGGPAR